MEQNEDFVCAMCGAEDMPGFVGSRLILGAGYGSAHDREHVTVPLCGECCDKLYGELVHKPGAVVEDYYPVGYTRCDIQLSEEARRYLDEGYAVPLDGGYIIIAPETIGSIAERLTIDALNTCKDDEELKASLIEALTNGDEGEW